MSACYHCGEPCADSALALAGKPFCCLGCQTVFSLLTENGLTQFYELSPAPGTRIRPASTRGKWAYLDDPAVRETFLDYADPRHARVTLQLPAIHCVACVWLLENLFQLHPGIGRSLVNFGRREASIAFNPERIRFSELAAFLASIGYEPEFTFGEREKSVTAPWRKRQWLQIGIAGFSFGNLMLMSLPIYLGLDSFSGPWFKVLAGYLSLALALPVVTYSASDFWRAAWRSCRHRVLTMEVPITLGLAAIYGRSLGEVLWQRGPGYCDSLCGLIFFLLCGRLFQRKTHDRLIFDRDYKGFFPLSILRKNAGGEEIVALARVQTGDHLILRNGELLPADARLVNGEACLDYSFVTGEAEPVARAAGEKLYAGGRQIGGAIEVETVKPVARSYLASLWDHEAFRKPRDPDLDSLTNRYSKRFTRLVIGVAVGAAGFWYFHNPAQSLKAFTSVLIVACPCALALAAPLTQGTAQRLLARRNIFLKNALVIERLSRVDTVVLDKTGTLTCADAGALTFAGADPLAGEEKNWIGSLARHSTHPLSVRLTRSLSHETLPVRSLQETAGGGLEGEVAGHRILLGSDSWLKSRGINSTVGCGEISAVEPTAASGWAAADGGRSTGPLRAEFSADRGSTVQVAIDGTFRGRFSLENSLRPEVAEWIRRLDRRFELVLLSGDHAREAVRFQELLGERAVLKFHQSPADKLNHIRGLQQQGRRVMMVGDGLNDAGALRQADVGVAVVEQIGVFSPASDIILDAAELPRLADVLAFSRHAAGVVRAGFVISALYNLAGISIAAAGLLSPILCAILMPVSSATVVVFTVGATTWLARHDRLFKVPEALPE